MPKRSDFSSPYCASTNDVTLTFQPTDLTHTAVFGNLAKKTQKRQPSNVNFTHARNFPFIFNVKLHTCAKIDVDIFCKIPQNRSTQLHKTENLSYRAPARSLVAVESQQKRVAPRATPIHFFATQNYGADVALCSLLFLPLANQYGRTGSYLNSKPAAKKHGAICNPLTWKYRLGQEATVVVLQQHRLVRCTLNGS